MLIQTETLNGNKRNLEKHKHDDIGTRLTSAGDGSYEMTSHRHTMAEQTAEDRRTSEDAVTTYGNIVSTSDH